MTAKKSSLLLDDIKRKLSKALSRFESSLKRLPVLPVKADLFNDEDLGAYEEWMSRFGRLTDLFLSQYIRAAVKIEDPQFSGSFRDFLNAAEKFKIIDSADAWYAVRELRNRQAHEYEEEDLLKLFKETLDQVERVRSISKVTL